MRYFYLFLAISSGMISSANANTVCPDPVFIMSTNSQVRLLHQIFNSGASSQRSFTEVHYIKPGDPHLTVGMGHWVHSKLSKLFHRLKKNDETWQLMTTVWADAMCPDQWEDFAKDTGETETNAAAISLGLSKLLCADDPSQNCIKNNLDRWSNRVGTRFNKSSHWFHAGWNATSILQPVAKEQVLYWTDSVVKEGQRAAEKRGLQTFGGVATTISAISSGIGATLFLPEATQAHVSSSFERSLVDVPRRARPDTESVNEEALLDDWKSLVAWQYYNLKKKRIRSRMREIWRVFYQPTWGPLPKTLAEMKKIPRHSGCYMVRGKFDTSVVIQPQPVGTNCKELVPQPKPLSCVTR